jgi:tetratricopeptide (TPR) repeat protein
VQPDYPLAANNLAYLLLEHGGNTDVALSYAQLARRGMPDNVNTADTLAWAYYNKGSYQMAIDLLQDAVKKSPKNPTYEYHLGMAYDGVKDRAHAKEHLERALELDPNYAKADEIRKVLAQLAS